MIKRIAILYVLLLIVSISKGQSKEIQLEEIWKERKFLSESPEGFNFTKEGLYFTRLESGAQQQINEYDIRTGKQTKTIFTASSNARISSYSFSDDEKKILLETEPERIYRHSTRADFMVFDRENKSTVKVSENGKQSYASFNPAADKVAFVRGNNIHIKDLKKNTEIQITNDGKPNEIINGASDWVYEEEFTIDQAFFWSPDGGRIAFLRFDERKVKEFTLTNYFNELYPNESKYKYPKAGELNADVSVHIYDLKSKKTSKIQIEGDGDYYIPRLVWSPEGDLCIYRLNRLQNHLRIYKTDRKGITELMFEEKNKYFIDIHDHMTFVDNDKFIWMSDADGYTHLYLYDIEGKLIRQLTKGAWDVTDFYGYDAKTKKVYFQAAATTKTCNREVYWVTTFADEKVKISEKDGENKASFSQDFKYYINEHSTFTSPPVFSVIESETNNTVRIVEDNSSLKTLLADYKIGNHNYIDFKNDTGDTINGWLMYPPNFDASKNTPYLCMFTVAPVIPLLQIIGTMAITCGSEC
jgi:dipeptidyl-peptidase-4